MYGGTRFKNDDKNIKFIRAKEDGIVERHDYQRHDAMQHIGEEWLKKIKPII